MVESEFERWKDFYLDFPFDDYHRIHRPFALSSSIGSKAKFEDVLELLQPEQRRGDISDADMSIIKAFGGKVN